MNPLWRGLLLALVALLLGGCLPVTSKSPLGTTAGLGADRALYGTWKGHNPDDPKAKDGYLHFMAGKDGALTAALVMADGGNDDGWTIFRVKTARLGGQNYLNAAMAFDKDAAAEGKLKDAIIPLAYVLRGDVLTLYVLDEEKVKAAVKAGKLKGTIEPGDSGDVTLADDPAALDAFFAKPEAMGLFKAMLVLKRV
ncbi:hypothetical protein FHS83_000932 [Rhizomicrobium palustre]|uniref:Lipoprotein n=1 Tax=Rhizomicrobium palustre TaxID=189966 RepID=A0A846MVU2_9PROT|nr:hypothetical protein [Rhizomicrobium palustre]NIK87614.1 hypothetical protein [Rhizomicrobium palustre]